MMMLIRIMRNIILKMRTILVMQVLCLDSGWKGLVPVMDRRGAD